MNKHRLQRHETLEKGLKQIAVGLANCFVSGLSAADEDRKVAIHDARKGCKMLRGFLRLVKPAMKAEYRSIDESIRDASARLAGLRDLDVMVKTLHRLHQSKPEQFNKEQLAAIQPILAKQISAEFEDNPSGKDPVTAFLNEMQVIVERIPQWAFDKELSLAAKVGFASTYRRGLKLLKVAQRVPTDENLHRWRKCVKYHEHQLRLLFHHWKGNAAKRISKLTRLAELLGDDHDLALIQARMRAHDQPVPAVLQEDWQHFLQIIENRRNRLQAKAFRLGDKLYQKRPNALARRITGV